MTKNLFKIKSEVWLYPEMPGRWHFASVPKKQSEAIRKSFGEMKRGWGSLPVRITLGKTSWRTSIFPDKKSGTYLFSLKSEVRRKEGIQAGDIKTFAIEIKV